MDFVLSIHFIGGFLSSASLWLMLVPVLVTLIYEEIYKPKINQIDQIDEFADGSHDYVVYLVLHLAVLITSFIVFGIDNVFDIIQELSPPTSGTITITIGLKLLGMGLGAVALFKYMRNSKELAKAYKSVDHGKSFSPPKVGAAYYRIISMIYFNIIVIIDLYDTYLINQNQ